MQFKVSGTHNQIWTPVRADMNGKRHSVVFDLYSALLIKSGTTVVNVTIIRPKLGTSGVEAFQYSRSNENKLRMYSGRTGEITFPQCTINRFWGEDFIPETFYLQSQTPIVRKKETPMPTSTSVPTDMPKIKRDGIEYDLGDMNRVGETITFNAGCEKVEVERAILSNILATPEKTTRWRTMYRRREGFLGPCVAEKRSTKSIGIFAIESREDILRVEKLFGLDCPYYPYSTGDLMQIHVYIDGGSYHSKYLSRTTGTYFYQEEEE